MRNNSKRVKSAKNVPFEDFVNKWSPHPNSPQIPKILHFKICFIWLKTCINLEVSATKIRGQIGNSPWEVAQQKLAKNTQMWFNFQHLSSYRKPGTEISNLGLNFTPEVVLRQFLRMCAGSGQNGSKRGKTGKNSASVLYLILDSIC